MKKQIPSKNENSENASILKKYTQLEVLEMIQEKVSVPFSPEALYKELGEELIPQHTNGSKKQQEEVEKRFNDKLTQAVLVAERDTHFGLAVSVPEEYRPMAVELTRNVMKEYECNTASEMMLAETTVNNYIRVLVYSRKFSGCVEAGEYISHERTSYLAVLSKELDRVQRQLTASILALKQLKSPSIEIKVKANTAFVANQQVNTR